MPSFIDRVVLHVAGGDGGNGCTSVHREKFKPLAGPDGGDGGHGGDVVLTVDPRVTTLLSYHRSPHQRAGNGTPGMGDWRRGTDGKDLVLPVPEGTVVKDEGSLNGTYVNRERIDETSLSSGDEVQIGKFRLVYLSNALERVPVGAPAAEPRPRRGWWSRWRR